MGHTGHGFAWTLLTYIAESEIKEHGYSYVSFFVRFVKIILLRYIVCMDSKYLSWRKDMCFCNIWVWRSMLHECSL